MAAPFNLPGEDNAQIYTFDKFGTLNTKANRPSIKDEEFSYNMNWMPIGDGNLRTLYAEGALLYTSPMGKTIVYNFPYNLGAVAYTAVFLSDGTAVQVQLSNGATTTISSTSGLFYDGSQIPCATQSAAQYLIILTSIAASPNSYFIWDGSVLYKAGTLSPDVTITAGGKGYTSAPTVIIYGGSGTGATGTAKIENGSVTGVNLTNPGSGYLVTDDPPQLAFTGGGSDATAYATVSVVTTGGVAAINITNSGTGATTSTTVSFSGGGGSGAQAVITGLVNGAVTQITITNPGTGYTSSPTVSLSGGSGFTAQVDVRYGQLGTFTIVSGGSGYKDNPQVLISAPDSDSLPVLQATAIAVVTAGAVSSIILTQAGLGYTKPPTVTLVGGNNSAQGTIGLMPFGVQGTTIETYQGAIWTANGPKISFTAPGTTSNFATSAGGGSFMSTNNYLRTNYVCLKQTAGTLYLIGDSSVDSIDNVTTSTIGSVVTTVFSLSNVDSQTGTPWRDSVTAFGRAIFFANANGVYALFGGAAEKVSAPLDGLFLNATFNTGAMGGVIPTSGVVTLFGIRCFSFLFTTIDPFTRLQADLQAIFDGVKWFLGNQINDMTFLSTSEIDSNLTLYGSTGTKIYPLFQTPSTSLAKTFQTRLRRNGSSIDDKQVTDIYLTAETTQGAVPVMNISIDTEQGIGQNIPLTVADTLTFVGTGPIVFVGTGPIVFTVFGLVVQQEGVSVYGRYIGLTCATVAADMVVLEINTLFNEYSPNA